MYSCVSQSSRILHARCAGASGSVGKPGSRGLQWGSGSHCGSGRSVGIPAGSIRQSFLALSARSPRPPSQLQPYSQ